MNCLSRVHSELSPLNTRNTRNKEGAERFSLFQTNSLKSDPIESFLSQTFQLCIFACLTCSSGNVLNCYGLAWRFMDFPTRFAFQAMGMEGIARLGSLGLPHLWIDHAGHHGKKALKILHFLPFFSLKIHRHLYYYPIDVEILDS